MATRDQQARLISPDSVDRVFDAATIRELAETAKLPASTDLGSLGEAIRAAVRQYRADCLLPWMSEHSDAIKGLARKVKSALAGQPGAIESVANALDTLHPATLEVLQDLAGPYRQVPTSADLRDPRRGRDALSLLYGQCHRGAEWKLGRKRPGGKRSRPTFQPILARLPVRRGRPRNRPEFMLCTRLGSIYWKATGKMPPRWADARNPGPFVRLVGRVLRLSGVVGVDAAELVNKSSARRRR